MDLNGDGYRDIISGSWPGELFFFAGQKGGKFAERVMLMDKDGRDINPGGGLDEWRDGGILVKGTAEFETVDGKRYVKYRGERLESTAEKPIAVSGAASDVSAADWDGDGDYDLIVSDIDGDVYLVRNGGTAKSWSFDAGKQLQAGGEPLSVGSRAGCAACDWDGDGDIDLLVGAGDGAVHLFENVGTAKSAKLAAAVELIERGKVSYGNDAPTEPLRGGRAKICAADWNGDGKLDVLVGDYARRKADLSGISEEEKAKHDEIRKELERITNRYGELWDQLYGPEANLPEAEKEAVREECDEAKKRLIELQDQLPREYEPHGWVWLFLRK